MKKFCELEDLRREEQWQLRWEYSNSLFYCSCAGVLYFPYFTVPFREMNFFLKSVLTPKCTILKEKSSAFWKFIKFFENWFRRREEPGLFVGRGGDLAFGGGAVGQVEEGAQGAPAEEAGIGDQGKSQRFGGRNGQHRSAQHNDVEALPDTQPAGGNGDGRDK